MYRMELFECSAATPIQLHLKAGSGIRVNSGRLWLTVEGQPEDIWLRGAEQWIAAQDVKVWISAEPVAGFGLLRPLVRLPQRPGSCYVSLPAINACSGGAP